MIIHWIWMDLGRLKFSSKKIYQLYSHIWGMIGTNFSAVALPVGWGSTEILFDERCHPRLLNTMWICGHLEAKEIVPFWDIEYTLLYTHTQKYTGYIRDSTLGGPVFCFSGSILIDEEASWEDRTYGGVPKISKKHVLKNQKNMF